MFLLNKFKIQAEEKGRLPNWSNKYSDYVFGIIDVMSLPGSIMIMMGTY